MPAPQSGAASASQLKICCDRRSYLRAADLFFYDQRSIGIIVDRAYRAVESEESNQKHNMEESDLATYVQKLAATARSVLSAGGNLQSIAGREQIDPSRLKPALAGHFASMHAKASPALDSAVADVIGSADVALTKVADGRSDQLTARECAALEVIVQVTGRPALRYIDGRVQPPELSLAENERWQVFVVVARKNIDRVSASVARLNRIEQSGDHTHVGTGWRLGDDLLVTNRHVAQLIQWQPGKSPCVADFAMTNNTAGPKLFEVESLAYCAEEDAVDAAVLRLKPTTEKLPPALEPAFDAIAVGDEIYVVGHPMNDATPQIQQVFGDADGYKRCSPGRTTGLYDEYPVFSHDCSTLRGNSGSVVLSVGTHRAVGLHFGGQPTDPAGTIGEANVAVAFANLGTHRFREILTNGQL
jgi:hypothetical protein